jgi:hypothetical protein
MIPFNAGIDSDHCTYNDTMNGYQCDGINYGTLKFESTAFDKKDILILPVNITNTNLGFKNVLNMGWEFKWINA